jgi:hypothetical protein
MSATASFENQNRHRRYCRRPEEQDRSRLSFQIPNVLVDAKPESGEGAEWAFIYQLRNLFYEHSAPPFRI